MPKSLAKMLKLYRLECRMIRFFLIFKDLRASKPQNGNCPYWLSIGRLAPEKWPLAIITNG